MLRRITAYRPKTRAQLRYLESKLQITRTDVVRLAIARLFVAEKRRQRAASG
jgi:hypothetical protein